MSVRRHFLNMPSEGFDLEWEVRWRPNCRVGSVSSAGMVSVIAVFFMVEQQVVQCTEQIPLLSSLPQFLFFSLSPFLSVSETSNVAVGWSLRCRPVWTLMSSLRYRSSIILPLASFSVSSCLFCLWKNPNYWNEKNNNQDLLCPALNPSMLACMHLCMHKKIRTHYLPKCQNEKWEE